jgi:hypothetical protein
VLPLEKYLPSYQDEMAVQLARDITEIDCMARFGFTDWVTEAIGAHPPIANNAANMQRRYGLAVLEEAREFGRRAPSGTSGSMALPDSDDPEARAVLEGRIPGGAALTEFRGQDVPEDGCVGEVAERVAGFDYTAEDLLGQSFVESQEDPSVQAAMGEWAGCMVARGYQVSTVWDLEAHYDSGTPIASHEEIALAVAEVECKEQTSLVAVWFERERLIQQALIDQNLDVLGEVKAHNEQALAAAEKISASSG